MDDTGLDLGLGKGRFDGLRTALVAVNDGNEDVLDAPIAQVTQNLSPDPWPRTWHPHVPGVVIPPFLMGASRRIQAAVFSFIAGVMPPMPMLGRSLL